MIDTNTILNIFQNYYTQIIGGTVSISAIIKIIIQWVKKYIITNMLLLEKDTTLTGEQKFIKLTTDIYNNLPMIIRLFITQNRFIQLSQAIYNRIFPVVKNENMDNNTEIKQVISSIITDAIDTLDKNTDEKIQQVVNQIQVKKKEELNKIAENLKQSLGVNNQLIKQSQESREVTDK